MRDFQDTFETRKCLFISALSVCMTVPLRISSVNVTKSTGNCGFGHIYKEIRKGKLHFLCSENSIFQPPKFQKLER